MKGTVPSFPSSPRYRPRCHPLPSALNDLQGSPTHETHVGRTPSNSGFSGVGTKL